MNTFSDALKGLVMGACLVVGSPWALAAEQQAGQRVTDPHFQLAPGYLDPARLPDSRLLLGPPPDQSTAAFARDEEARQYTIPLRGNARWLLARQDADLNFPQPAKNFSCALGVPIDEASTPVIYNMMRKVLTDAGLSTYGVKNTYKRVRPFVEHAEGTCWPEQEALLREDGSYPSGHTAAGWAWALVLAEIHPERADALLSRGLAFGQSRVICNAHWQSDVDAGRVMGAATVAVLHADAAFQADLDAARQELRRAQAAAALTPALCAAESSALGK